MDYFYIEKVSKEIGSELEKRRVSAIYLSDKKLALQFGSTYLNCYFGVPNALFLSSQPISQTPFPHLNPVKGAFLKSAQMPYPDRVIELSFVKILSPTEFEKFYLILELTGKNANLFLLDSERRIKFLLRPLKSSVRELTVKDFYLPPPLDKRPLEEISFGKVTKGGIESSLHKYALFVSPLSAKEIASIYAEVGDLKEAYKVFLSRHRSSSSAFLYYREGKPYYLTTFKYKSLEGLDFKEFTGSKPYSMAWEEFYKERVLKCEVETLRDRLLARLKKRKDALLKELSELKGEEELLSKAEEFKKFGELLKGNLHRVLPGMDSVTVFDYERGEEVKVPLDPSLSPKENLEALFKSYRKLRRKAEISASRREEVEEELTSVEALIDLISSLEDLGRLRKLSGEVSVKVSDKGKLKLRSFTLPSGKKIVVGRSSKENELISLKLSNPWDLWFHARDIPGSHVILRLRKGEEPSKEDILLASCAAAYFSKGRYSGKVPVDYTRAKNLKKPPKSPAGFLTYSGEKTLWVKPEVFEEFMKAPKEGAKELTGKQR